MLDAHVVKVRPRFTVDVVVQVSAGEACGLFGVSGSGKSTILSCIAGAERPDRGRIVLGTLVLFPPALPLHLRSIGYLSQDANLFAHLRVDQNVCYGLRGTAGAATDAWIAELREQLQLEAVWREPAAAISGGQARRVALARMLAPKPRLVLLDEPFSGLDRQLVRELLTSIAQWQKRLGFTMLVADHQADALERLCSRAIALEAGRLVQDATWNELRARPATQTLAQLLAPL